MVGEESFACKGLRTGGAKGCDHVSKQIRTNNSAVGTLFLGFVVVIDVVPHLHQTAHHFRTVRTLSGFGQVAT